MVRNGHDTAAARKQSKQNAKGRWNVECHRTNKPTDPRIPRHKLTPQTAHTHRHVYVSSGPHTKSVCVSAFGPWPPRSRDRGLEGRRLIQTTWYGRISGREMTVRKREMWGASTQIHRSSRTYTRAQVKKHQICHAHATSTHRTATHVQCPHTKLMCDCSCTVTATWYMYEFLQQWSKTADIWVFHRLSRLLFAWTNHVMLATVHDFERPEKAPRRPPWTQTRAVE